MLAHDVIYEIGHALDAYQEADGHTFDLDHESNETRATLTVTAPDGSAHTFRICVEQLRP